MLNILNAFENIEVKNENRISGEDLEVIKNYQKDFDEFRSNFLQYEKFYINNPLDAPVYEGYNYNDTKSYKMLEKLYENFMKDACKFINTIYYYFQNKYNVSLENNFNEGAEYCAEYRKEESEKRLNFYKNKLNYNLILDDIFIQLDGFDFNSKAEQELKNLTSKIYRYDNYKKIPNIIIENNKVTIDNYYAYKDSLWNEYRLTDNCNEVFTSLYHFDKGEISNNTELHCKYCGYENQRNQDNFEKYTPYSFNKLKSIKFFKNGKLQLEFTKSQYTLSFAKEYLGYEEINKLKGMI